jgi:hypothetical protein
MEAFVDNVRKTTLFALLAVMAACGENTVGPKEQVQDVPNVQGQGVSTALSSTDTIRFSMTINPYSSTYVQLGAGNSISFPAASVCDPTTTTYGMGYWDSPCTAAKVPITVNVKAWMTPAGHAKIDFSPNIRFVPSALPTGWVTLTFADYAASQDPFFNILYCPTITNSNCVDESKLDPTVATVKNPVTGQLTRRVKHFSGYMVGAGDGDSSIASMSISASKTGPSNTANAQSVKYDAVKIHNVRPGQTASADIGPEGGILRLGSAGLTVEVPAGAVSTRTHFSVSAHPGNLLGYDFEPHGTHFAVPLRVTQSLRSLNSAAANLTLTGLVYFANESQVDQARGTVTSSELTSVVYDRPQQTVTFNVVHFSGYMLVSGRSMQE